MNDSWYVLFVDPPAQWLRAAELLAAASRVLSLADATAACRAEGGLVGFALSRAEANHAAGALSAGGFAALAVPAERLVLPAPPLQVGYARAAPEGLFFRADWLGTMRLLPWSWLRLWRVSLVWATLGTHSPLRGAGPGRPAMRLGSGPGPEPQDWAPVPHDAADEDGAHHQDGAHHEGNAPFLTRDDLLAAGHELAGAALSLALGAPLLEVIRFGYMAAEMQATGSEQAEATLEAHPPHPTAPEVWLELFAPEPPVRLRIRHDAFDYRALGPRRQPAARLSFAELVRQLGEHLVGVQATGLVAEARSGRNLATCDKPMDSRQHELDVIGWLTRLSLRGTAPPRQR